MMLALGIALSALLASCDNGYDAPICYSCNVAPTEYSKGVVAADFNGDGLPDVVALSLNSPHCGPWVESEGLPVDRGRRVRRAVADGGLIRPPFIVSADLNGDGTMDLVSASYDDAALSVFFNDTASPGTFNAPLVLNSPGASQVAIADMNGDGLPDLVSADFNVSLFVQTSAGTFAAPVALYSGGANWVAVGDLNGDGAPDVALTDAVGAKLLMHYRGCLGHDLRDAGQCLQPDRQLECRRCEHHRQSPT